MHLPLMKNYHLRCWGCLFVVMSIGVIALCLIRKLENWSINLCEVPSSEVVLYPCISTNQPCMECCFHVWTGDLNCYLDMLGKLQEQVCRVVSPTLATSSEPFAHLRNVVMQFQSFMNWLNLLFFVIFKGDLLFILKICMDFLPFIGAIIMLLSTVFFYSQTMEFFACKIFLLTYGLNINGYFFHLGFLISFSIYSPSLPSSFLVTIQL